VEKDGHKGAQSSRGEAAIKSVEGMPEGATQISRSGLWDSDYSHGCYNRQVYGDDMSVRRGVAFLAVPEICTVEDWGCGYGGVKLYLAPHQRYIGVDGSSSKFADVIADLEYYRSNVDAIFMRHVLDHNPNWHLVLKNAVASFAKKMVLVLFTPFQETTRVLREYPAWGETVHSMWDIGFNRDDIVQGVESCSWSSEENLPSRTGYGVEHIFYLEKP
jgi:hypothetical protein